MTFDDEVCPTAPGQTTLAGTEAKLQEAMNVKPTQVSKNFVTQKPLIIFAVAASALMGITVFIASGDSPSISSVVRPVLISSNAPLPSLDCTTVFSRRSVEPECPPPGVYKATRYTLVVVVPRSVDDKMVVGVGGQSRFKLACMKPDTGLEPMVSPPLKIPGLSGK